MFRNLLATTAIATLLTTAAQAQNTTAPAPASPAPMSQDNNPSGAPAMRADGHLASNLIGETVYNSTGDDAQNIGKVKDLVISPNGMVESLVVGVGGFLGLGEKNVAVNYGDADQAEQNGKRWLVVNASKDQLKALPDFDRRAYDVAPVSAADTSAPVTNNLAQAPTNGGGAMAPAHNKTAMAPTQPDTMTTASIDKSLLTRVPVGEIRSAELTGTTVYGSEDANVGKIGDVVLSGDGKVDAVIIDVGGFLGIGSKEVAVGMDNLAFMVDKGGKKYLYTNFTKDQLKSQPAYDKSTYSEKRDQQRMIEQQ
ncbi:PRC-barrel domain-containing protein [Pseudaminobacter soli (ex Li et al. 2025)]|uniref:Photosystem reaction center subunit H n=1 Tax=Pseudaminobacter soli (ex Li et al. 2025) TaxID=1295366 RepID=A0A2P7SA48_9HYPH|nr:PRC-barrel domain-containing protein [Mesorhizobium soli]PSJ59356.1 photosystem reaction center subunit H [Mesorhizobium soli]